MIKLSKHTKCYSVLVIAVLALGTGLFFQFKANQVLKIKNATQQDQTQQVQEALTQEERSKTDAQTQATTLLSEKSALEKEVQVLKSQINALQGTRTKLVAAEKTVQALKQQLSVLQERTGQREANQQKQLDHCVQEVAHQYEVHALNQRIQQLETKVN